ncbi:MAG TPA: hypothetical protein VLX56_02335 [Nitrososphaerales archaeon]|nr:hypothetical protein [Nitrososphaerales archaeon]
MSSPSSDLAGLEARTMKEVRGSTRFLLRSFKGKTDQLKSTAGPDVGKLLRFGVDRGAACATAREFFGKGEVGYIAIDGTQGMDQHLDLLVFYVGAFGYAGALRFAGDEIEVGDPSPMTTSSAAVSASIPLSEEDASTVFGQKTESGTEVEVDSERLPGAVMHLAEYHIAVQSLSSPNPPGVVLLDRTLAGDVAHLVWSTRDLVRGHACVLEGMTTPAGQVTNLDLELARLLVVNPELEIPSPRSQLLRLAALSHLFAGDALTAGEILVEIGADATHLPVLEQDLAELESEYHLFEAAEPGKFKLDPRVKDYWARVLAAAELVAGHVFNPEGGHPLRISLGEGGERWITADDIEYLVLVMVLELTRRAWSGAVLPIGLTKDSGAAELVKTVVPVLRDSGLESFGEIPNFNSDKMLLQTNSVVNAATVPTPWHTIDIDAAFRTMVRVQDASLPKGEARVRGAYRNVIYPERTFVKCYIQLWSSKNEPSVRSHVFAFDRPAYPGYDHWGEMLIHNRDNEIDERISPILHFKEGSAMTNLAMSILFRMSGEVIPEALGHNYPLFLADKKAKFVLKQNRAAYLGAVDVEMAKSDLDQQVLFSQRFRDYRSKVESQRKSGGV